MKILSILFFLSRDSRELHLVIYISLKRIKTSSREREAAILRLCKGTSHAYP